MLEIGSTIGGMYKILHEVGKGGMSVVYMAINEKANQNWAVKVIRKDGGADSNIKTQRLAVEIDIMKRLRHEYLPRIVDVLEQNDSFIIIMDYIEGKSLEKGLEERLATAKEQAARAGYADRDLETRAAFDQEDVVKWAMQLCEVLDYLHNKEKIIYRDMKPANIMLRPNGDVTLIDFGTAREYKVDSTKDTISLGTIGYAAPEQYNDPNQDQRQTDARTDIYSLGVTMHRLVTGKDPTKPPYDLLPIREINPNLSEGLQKIIVKCTQRDPNKRYQSAAELLYDLEHYKEGDEIYRKAQKKKLAAFIGSTAMAVILAVVSIVTATNAQNQLGKDYEHRLQSAQSIEDYHDAILTDPGRIEAYKGLNELVDADALLTAEEGMALSRLLVGLDSVSGNGYHTTVHVLDELLAASPEGYQQICFDIGWSFLSHYYGDDEARYANAAKWFSFIRENDTENGRTAELFCRISEIMTKIKQLQGSKVTQTEGLRQQREELWQGIKDLRTASDGYEEARRLETWIEIESVIQRYTLDFVDVVEVQELVDMLTEIQTAAETSLDNMDVRHLAEKLIVSTGDTITKIMSVEG